MAVAVGYDGKGYVGMSLVCLNWIYVLLVIDGTTRMIALEATGAVRLLRMWDLLLLMHMPMKCWTVLALL